MSFTKLTLIAGLLLLSLEIHAQTKLNIITSIKPLQLITNEILDGIGQAEVLVDDKQSPHHFQLKPSQMKRLAKADLVIWVSNEFETGLSKIHSILPASSSGLQLIKQIPASQLITDDHHSIDGHIWLAPENIISIAKQIRIALSKIDPAHKKLLQINEEKFINKLLEWKKSAQQLLDRTRPQYILDHQFLAYFEKSLRLSNSGTLRDAHDHGSRIRQVSALNQHLEKKPANCLLVASLPLTSQDKQIRDHFNLQVKLIDTLGNQTSYPDILALLNSITKSLLECD